VDRRRARQPWKDIANSQKQGFTLNYSGFENVDAMVRALDVAQRAGIKQIASVPELADEPVRVVDRCKDHPALGGYYLRDEPASSDFPALAQWVDRISALDRGHPCYINLFPNYATATQLGSNNYQEYIQQFVAEVPVQFLSFDHYPVVGESLRKEWYENLEIIARTARDAHKPFWAFALSVAHGPYPVATLEQLRLQVFSNLAYGAQGIQYFTYWTFRSNEWNFHEGPIDAEGRRTAVYERVKQVNGELRALSHVFFGARVVQVTHTGALPNGTVRYQAAAPVNRLTTEGTGAIVSLLQKEARRSLVIINRDLHVVMPLVVEFDESTTISEVRKDGPLHRLPNGPYRARLDPGDVAILQWEQ
jgi:hypothetical protein